MLCAAPPHFFSLHLAVKDTWRHKEASESLMFLGECLPKGLNGVFKFYVVTSMRTTSVPKQTERLYDAEIYSV